MKTWLTPLSSLVVCVVCIAFSGCAAFIRMPRMHQAVPPPELHKTFQPAELKEDIEFLFRTLEDVHPNLYTYAPKSTMTQERERIEQEIISPMSRIDFYIKIAPLVARLRDGHTSVSPPYEESQYRANKGGLFFPLNVDFRDGKAFVAASYSSDSLLTVGSELLSINGLPINTILDNLLQFFSGEKVSFNTGLVENNLRRMLWLVYRFEQEYEIEYISQPTGEYCTRTVNGVNAATFMARRRENGSRNEQPVNNAYYAYHSLPAEKIGFIDFRSMFITSLKEIETFEMSLKQTFIQTQRDSVTSLIIDIRKNGGGNSMLGDALLRYLTYRPFAEVSREEVKVSKQLRKFYKGFLRWYIRWLPVQYFHPYGRTIWTTPEGRIAVLKPKSEVPKGSPLRFKGHVYVLIGPMTFSSASGFAAIIKDYQIGTLVGEETGGLATAYGDIYPFDLPHSRLAVGVSHKRFVRPSGEDDGRGVLPDYEVRQSIEDSEKGIDTVMEFTKQLIQSDGKKTQR